VLQNSLKSPFLPSQLLCNFLGIFPQIFLPPESLYSISNPILIQKSIKIEFSFYSFGFQPEQWFRPGLLNPFLAQSARRLPLTDRWAHPVSEPDRLLPPGARSSDAAGSPSLGSFPSRGKTNRRCCPPISPTPRFASPFPPPPETPSPLKLHRAPPLTPLLRHFG
jgi:hypothetical protein